MKTEFSFIEPSQGAAGSVLQQEHLKRVPPSRLAPFAGTLMPLWFSSIQQEHQAVRATAGLFDCTHMGVLSLTGDQAAGFINTVATNQVDNLANGLDTEPLTYDAYQRQVKMNQERGRAILAGIIRLHREKELS